MSERLPSDQYRDTRRKHERLAQARAVAGPEPTTLYRVADGRGGVEELRDRERAARLSRAGYRVTAVSHTEGRR